MRWRGTVGLWDGYEGRLTGNRFGGEIREIGELGELGENKKWSNIGKCGRKMIIFGYGSWYFKV